MTKILTIQDLLHRYYGRDVTKADDPVLTTTTGVFNAVYGAMAFSQLNNEANAFALLPKRPWEKSGWRVIIADAGTTGDGGTPEAGALADSTKPDFREIETKPKQVQHVFQSSYIQDGLVASGDDATGDIEWLRGYFATKHAKAINQQLLTDADTLAGDSFESIDRVAFSTAARISLSYTDGDEDIYGIDRSANAWADAVVDENAGVDRDLTDDLIKDTLATLEQNGARTNIFLTGNDTKFRVFSLYENQVRYPGVVGKENVKVGINGVETEDGTEVGLRVATVYGIPMFTSQDVVKDTISRIYLLDTTENENGVPRLFISLLYPTLFAESGMSAKDQSPFAIDSFSTKGVYYTSGELISTFLAAQASIRDLK